MLQHLTKLLFPAECVGCAQEGDWLCGGCRRNLPVTPAERCRICHKGQFTNSGLCRACQGATGLDGIVALFSYSAPAIQNLIKTAKYLNQSDALKFFVAVNRLKLLRALPEADWVFSFAPLDRARFAERGFNQAELVARGLAAKEYASRPLFKKLAPTPHQADLDGRQRRANLKKAFRLAGPMSENVVICDDVITTGTTLSRLAKLAKKNGAQKVWAMTLAHS